MSNYSKLSLSQAQTATKALRSETFKLNASSVIYLFEIDLSDILIDKQIIFDKTDDNEDERILRFHNSINFLEQGQSIYFRGKRFHPTPFKMDGFEATMQGTIPKPRMGIAVHEVGVKPLSIFKSKLRELDDLVGAKLTRYKTFAKFIDFENFKEGEVPQGFTPGVNAEFPREVYYIERKSNENRYVMEFELSSRLDVEGVRLPRRIILSSRCPWTYRGEGCCYEYPSRFTDLHDGVSYPDNFEAKAVATQVGHKISNVLKMGENQFVDRGEWEPEPNPPYTKGNQVFVQKDLIKYYFVARDSVPNGVKPPNESHWIADECSKDIPGCKLRFLQQGTNLPLRFGGFPSAERQRGV